MTEIRNDIAQPGSLASGAEKLTQSRILDPIDRSFEILFGLFMVLTFTGTLSVASAERRMC